MDFSSILLLLLGMWVFILQSRIKDLDQIVRELREKSWQNASNYTIDHADEASEMDSEATDDDKHETTLHPEPTEAEVAISKYYEERSASADFTTADEQEANSIQYMSNDISEEEESTPVSETYSPKEEVYTPSEPSWLVNMVTGYFTGGNLLVRIGGVVLFFGLAFLVKYIAEHSHISMGARLSMIAAVGIGFIAGGWRLREREGAYGQILQGLGIATLYLVIYAAAKFYSLISLNAAFALMLSVVVIGSFLASRQKSLPLMLFATAGGFMVPILTSSGNGSHIILFGYYLLLDTGIFMIAWKHAWRVLNIVGFAFTFIIATAWGVLRYDPMMFSTTEPFLIAFFLLYLMITILFARNTHNHLIDTTLLFGLPAVVFPLQLYLVSDAEYGGGYSAVAMGVLYLSLSKLPSNKVPNTLLKQSFLTLGVVFLTASVPYFFGHKVTAAIWSMEAAATIWLSLKQERIYARYFGELLLLVSTALFLEGACCHDISISIFLGYLIVVGALFFASYILHINKQKLDLDGVFSEIFLGLSLFVWMVSAYGVSTTYHHYHLLHKLTIGLIIGTALLYTADRVLKWDLLGKILQFALPAGAVMFLLPISIPYHLDPFTGIGWLSFIALFGWGWYMLWDYDDKWIIAPYLHIGSLWFGVAMTSMSLFSNATESHLSMAAEMISAVIIPLIATLILLKVPLYRSKLLKYADSYKRTGVGGLALFMGLWEIAAMVISTDGMKVPYVPVLNLLDIVQIGVLYALYLWGKELKARALVYNIVYLMGVALASVFYARAVHHYSDIPYTINGLWDHLSFQLGLVLIWSVIIGFTTIMLKRSKEGYLRLGSAILVAIVLIWEVYAFSSSHLAGSSYMPVMNPLDITQLIALAASAFWLYTLRQNFDANGKQIGFLANLLISGSFVSVVFARAVHHYQNVPYHLYSMWHSLYFQTGLSILWSMIGLGLMFLSKRYSSRPFWFAAFGILSLVVLKLFFIELANSGTIERIISFIVVGSLLLLIGYFVPLPPESDTAQNNTDETDNDSQ